MPETILDIFKNSIIDLKPTIEEELESKRAMKVVIVLHAAFHQATDPNPVLKSLPLEILLATDIDQVLHTMIKQILKRVDEYLARRPLFAYTSSLVTLITLTFLF